MAHRLGRRIVANMIGCALFLIGIDARAREPQGKSDPPRFELRAGDRVVLLGSGLIEQERRHGYLEMRLSRRVPEGALVFRNLGWAGDTIRGIARTSGFQNPEGFARLLKEVQDHQPTVLVIGYGTNESFDGPAGLHGFRNDYARLLAKLAPLKARIVLFSPLNQENLGPPFPDPAAHNRDVELYGYAIQQLAEDYKCVFVDLRKVIDAAKLGNPRWRLTTNGVQLSQAGSDRAARIIEEQLGLPPYEWRVKLDAAGKVLGSKGMLIEKVVVTKGNIRFQATEAMLAVEGDSKIFQIVDLPPGRYSVKVDGTVLESLSAAEWKKGFGIGKPAKMLDSEILRQAIIANNVLFYRRWRPFNDHSRHWGFIGGDGALYDQEMTAQEKIIAQRRRPQAHHFEINRTGDSK